MTISQRQVSAGIFLVSTSLLSACASTTLQQVQRAPDYQATRIHKVLVVCITQKPGVRSRWENEFVRQWKARGEDAVASADVLPAGVTLDKAGVAPVAKAQGFDSVLVMRLLKREKIKPETPDGLQTSGDRPPAVLADDPALTPYVHAIVAAPNEPIDFEVAVVSTKLFDVATKKAVWSAVSQTLLTGDAIRRARPFVKDILNHIY